MLGLSKMEKRGGKRLKNGAAKKNKKKIHTTMWKEAKSNLEEGGEITQ